MNGGGTLVQRKISGRTTATTTTATATETATTTTTSLLINGGVGVIGEEEEEEEEEIIYRESLLLPSSSLLSSSRTSSYVTGTGGVVVQEQLSSPDSAPSSSTSSSININNNNNNKEQRRRLNSSDSGGSGSGSGLADPFVGFLRHRRRKAPAASSMSSMSSLPRKRTTAKTSPSSSSWLSSLSQRLRGGGGGNNNSNINGRSSSSRQQQRQNNSSSSSSVLSPSTTFTTTNTTPYFFPYDTTLKTSSYNAAAAASQQQQQQQHLVLLDSPYTTTNATLSSRTLSHLESQSSDPTDAQTTTTTTATTTTSMGRGEEEHDDRLNYALLIALYTLQGIPMGLSASIPFLIQQKMQAMAAVAVLADGSSSTSTAANLAASSAAAAAKLSYKANAIFALCSWPFSLKLLWAPVVDACFSKRLGRRKSWLVPVQTAAGLLMVAGANFVERQLGLDTTTTTTSGTGTGTSSTNGIINSATTNALHQQHHATTLNVKGVTAFFFGLYFLMATQDIAVDGWALTMLSKHNRGRGPICNSIGQNIGYFLSFVGFLALNDIESSEHLWRPLLGLPSDPTQGLVSLQTFIRYMGYFMLLTTTLVAFFKREEPTPVLPKRTSSAASMRSTNSNTNSNTNNSTTITTEFDYNNAMPESSQALLQADRLNLKTKNTPSPQEKEVDEEHELDASELGLRETYRRLWAVCKLPAVQWLFLILFTYRLPTAVSDNVKFLKAVEYGLSKSTTALLSPTVILPLGIFVPVIAAKLWHGHPLRQFMTAYHFRVTLVPLLDAWMLTVLQQQRKDGGSGGSGSLVRSLTFWTAVVSSTAMQAICNSLQFNAQMTFFASRVDPAIGGSYMTLLNTAANLGGTYPASFVMWLVGALTKDKSEDPAVASSSTTDPYFILQFVFACLGILWIVLLGKRVDTIAHLPEDAWRTHWLDKDKITTTTTTGRGEDDYDEEGAAGPSGKLATAAEEEQQPFVVVPSRLRPFAIWSASRGGEASGATPGFMEDETDNNNHNNKNKEC